MIFRTFVFLLFVGVAAFSQNPSPSSGKNIDARILENFVNQKLHELSADPQKLHDLEATVERYQGLLKNLPTPEQVEQLEQLKPLLESPLFKKYMGFATDPAILASMKNIVLQGGHRNFFYLELALFIALIFLRTILTSQNSKPSFFSSLWTSAWTMALYVGTTFIVLRRLYYGPDAAVIANGVFRLISN